MLLFTLERSVNNMTTQESMGLKIKGLREDKKLSQLQKLKLEKLICRKVKYLHLQKP